MSTVIKSGTSAHAVQRVAFNLEDISQQAEAYLDQVRVKAAQIVVEAQKQADTLRRKAEQEGQQAAMRAVERVLEEKVSKKLDSLLPALSQTIRDLADARQSWQSHWEKSVVRLACAIAEKITRRELRQHPEIAVELAREALEMAAGSPHVEIRLHPTDRESLASQIERLVHEFAGTATAEIIADPAIELGSCCVDTRHGSIDQQFRAQLARIEAELTGGNDG
ncbi:MAG TPA: FliH/SctL family protein [Pirellulales bacterium]|jgi:flagellar assembly protein FliH|nr:FliH/SctL family protein [Pirellulales bacterium]